MIIKKITIGTIMKINLDRFLTAQKQDYPIALQEIKEDVKQSHWMWYIFPQVKGLGQSDIAKFYAIQSKAEACEYLNNDVLNNNLIEITEVLLGLVETDATKIFGHIDTLKLQSSMTLFACLSNENSIFHKVLEKYFNGKMDTFTQVFLKNE